MTILALLITLLFAAICPATGNKACHDDGNENFPVFCGCGKTGQKVVITLENCLQITGKIYGFNLLRECCDKYMFCESCMDGLNRCKSCPQGKYGRFCDMDLPEIKDMPDAGLKIQRTERSADENEDIPLHSFSILAGQSRPNRHRLRRVRNCEYPDALPHSNINCVIYSKRVRCNQTCVWGYKLSSGLNKTMVCMKDENRWKPSSFEPCKVFLICEVGLKFPGDYKCIQNKPDGPPSCFVSCKEYDDNSAVPLTEHVCDDEGDWHPDLPFCAFSRSRRMKPEF